MTNDKHHAHAYAILGDSDMAEKMPDDSGPPTLEIYNSIIKNGYAMWHLVIIA